MSFHTLEESQKKEKSMKASDIKAVADLIKTRESLVASRDDFRDDKDYNIQIYDPKVDGVEFNTSKSGNWVMKLIQSEIDTIDAGLRAYGVDPEA